MFIKGLVHRVDIYPMQRNTSNRTVKAQMKADEPVMEDVRCRIVKDERIMFEKDIKLNIGDVVRDKAANKEYIVEDEYEATGFSVHHRSYIVKKKVI